MQYIMRELDNKILIILEGNTVMWGGEININKHLIKYVILVLYQPINLLQ